MQIKNGLPKFRNETALIIVSGTNDARLFEAKNGEINETGYIKAEKPDYSDREGHFKVRSASKAMRSGAVYEDKEHIVKKDYFKTLRPILKRYTNENEPTYLYLFCPQPIKEEIRNVFPPALQSKLTLVETGNYNHRHPFDLLEKIQVLDKKRKVLQNYQTEAKKILDKFQSIGTYLHQRLY
ncbi:MAG TPA: hypothetical protein VJH75_03250 [Patescibacteria group bacterium]|nr:hypothetical protein [Patescibacteria group bacterium]